MTNLTFELFCRNCNRCEYKDVSYEDLPDARPFPHSPYRWKKFYVGCSICKRAVICLLNETDMRDGFGYWDERDGLIISMDVM